MYGIKAFVFKADCGVIAECEKLVKDSIEALGGLDIVIGNAVRTTLQMERRFVVLLKLHCSVMGAVVRR